MRRTLGWIAAAAMMAWAFAASGAPPTQETPRKIDRVQVRSESGIAKIVVDFPYNGDSIEKKMNMGEECTDNPCSAPNLATKVAALDDVFNIITVQNTNNNAPVDPGGHTADVFIGNIEESTSYIHLEVFDVATTINEVTSTSPRAAQEVVDYVRGQGGLVFLGHAAFTQGANNIESVIGLHGLDGIDIWDDITTPSESLVIATRYLDRAVMSGGRRLVLVAEADCQGTNGLCTGLAGASNGTANFLYFPSSSITKDQVKQVLSDGNFVPATTNTIGDYLLPSSPPDLNGLTISFTTKSTGAGSANADCQWIGFGNTVLETDTNVSASVAASYTIQGGEGYVFARCTRDLAPTTDLFWTQPVFVSREPFRAGRWPTITNQLWDIAGSNWLPHEIRTSPGTRFIGSTEDTGGDASYPMWIFDTVLAPAGASGDYIEFHTGGTGQPTIANTDQTTRRSLAKMIIDNDGTLIVRSTSAGHAGTINYATATNLAMPLGRVQWGAPAANDFLDFVSGGFDLWENNVKLMEFGAGCSGFDTSGLCVDLITTNTVDDRLVFHSTRVNDDAGPIFEFEPTTGQTWDAGDTLIQIENPRFTNVSRIFGDGAQEMASNLSRASAQNARFANVPVGTAAPVTPNNGDLWATVDNFTTPTSFSVFGRVNGVTVRTPASDTAGACLSGDTATAFFTLGQIEAARGGTGIDSSALTGVARLTAGAWSADAGISHLAASTSADLRGTLSDETGTGAAIFSSPTAFTLDVEAGTNAITTVSKIWLVAAMCDNATASANFDTPTANAAAAACVTGTNTQKGYLDFDGVTDESVQGSLRLPSDWTGAIDVNYTWLTTATTGSAAWCLQLVCVADAETGDPAFPAQAAGNCVSDAAKATASQYNDAADTGITATGCAAGEIMYYRISRDPDQTSTLTDDIAADARLVGIELTLRRTE